jgi:hypothetical protein
MTVSSWGTGRPDYSVNIEYSTEPILRSHQNQYNYYLEITDLAPSSSLTTLDIDIPIDTVVLLYDFCLTSVKNQLLEFIVQAKGTGGGYTTIFYDENYQNIYHPIPNGFPFFDEYRIKYRNRGQSDTDLILSIHGLYTGEDEYYLTYQGAPI